MKKNKFFTVIIIGFIIIASIVNMFSRENSRKLVKWGTGVYFSVFQYTKPGKKMNQNIKIIEKIDESNKEKSE